MDSPPLHAVVDTPPPAMAPSSDTIWLIRHGESQANAGLRTLDPRTIALTDKGREQAMRLADQVQRRPDWIVVSPFERTLQTAEPTLVRHAGVSVEVWPIQELTYLSPPRCAGTSHVERREWALEYWQRANPDHVDGPGAESFTDFVARVQAFAARLQATSGHGLVFGHGMFLKAYLLACAGELVATPEGMRHFRAAESAAPLRNTQVIAQRRQPSKSSPPEGPRCC